MRQSSTLASKYRPTLIRLIVTLVLSLLLLSLVDQIVGLIIDQTTIEEPFSLPPNGPGIVRFWKLTDSGISPIVFLGSSQMQAALAPDQFDNRIQTETGFQLSSVNLSIKGAYIRVTRSILSDLVVPANIHTVFVGLEMRALHSGSLEESEFQSYLDTPLGYAVSRPLPLERWVLLTLLKHSAFFRYQVNLQNWLTGNRTLVDPAEQTDAFGHWVLKGLRGRSVAPIKESVVPFHSDQALQRALDDIATECDQAKLDCIFLNLPLHPDVDQYITSRDRNAYWAIVLDIAKVHGIPVWDFDTAACHMVFNDPLFYDLTHLNQDGAMLFTDVLARLYIQHRFNPSHLARDSCVHFLL